MPHKITITDDSITFDGLEVENLDILWDRDTLIDMVLAEMVSEKLSPLRSIWLLNSTIRGEQNVDR